MKRGVILVAIILSAIVAGELKAQSYDYSTIAQHPRLLLAESEEASVRQAIEQSRALGMVDSYIREFADETLSKPPVERIKEGVRLLAVSREALKRIFYLSYTYRLHGGEEYARRAVEEMLAVSEFVDWNPTHFLDVGEMAMAVAIGYDWLHDYMSAEERRIIREAIIEKAFEAAKNPKHAWFYERTINWNSVCNAGLLYGALAVYDDAAEVAVPIIERCMETNPKAMSAFAPDGAYPEGYNYWGYGTTFQVLLIAALDSALGSDNGLSQAEGFMNTARFMQIMGAPSLDCFNFYDSGNRVKINPAMYWFASKSGDASLTYLENRYIERGGVPYAEDRTLPLLPIFAAHLDLSKESAPRSNFWVSGGETPLYIYRGGWDSERDSYLGVKAGSPSSTHAHCDAGSFVYEKSGVRWAADLGMQNYYSIEKLGMNLWDMSQNSQRWDVFRLSNRAHNTLFVNNKTCNVRAYAHMAECFTTDKRKGAVVDLSDLYEGSLSSAVRSVTLDKRDNLTVVDNMVGGEESAHVEWVMCTTAEARIISKSEMELSRDGERMVMNVKCNYPFELKIWSNAPTTDYDAPNPGTQRVGVAVDVPAKKGCKIEVSLISK